MPISYVIDQALGIVRITAERDSTPADHGRLARCWLRDPAYRAGMSILVDNRRMGIGPTCEQIRELAETSRHMRDFEPGTRCALVAADDLRFGLARMFSSISEDAPLHTRVFRNVPEAEAWLKAPPRPFPGG